MGFQLPAGLSLLYGRVVGAVKPNAGVRMIVAREAPSRDDGTSEAEPRVQCVPRREPGNESGCLGGTFYAVRLRK